MHSLFERLIELDDIGSRDDHLLSSLHKQSERLAELTRTLIDKRNKGEALSAAHIPFGQSDDGGIYPFRNTPPVDNKEKDRDNKLFNDREIQEIKIGMEGKNRKKKGGTGNDGDISAQIENVEKVPFNQQSIRARIAKLLPQDNPHLRKKSHQQ